MVYFVSLHNDECREKWLLCEKDLHYMYISAVQCTLHTFLLHANKNMTPTKITWIPKYKFKLGEVI